MLGGSNDGRFRRSSVGGMLPMIRSYQQNQERKEGLEPGYVFWVALHLPTQIPLFTHQLKLSIRNKTEKEGDDGVELVNLLL